MPFKKGQSGNPAGRPRAGQSFADCLRETLKGQDKHGVSRLEMVAEALISKAEQGDIAAIREIAARLDGPATGQSTKENPIVIHLTEADMKLC